MAVYLKLDENTSIEIEAGSRAEGQIAGAREDVYLLADDLTDRARKIAECVKSGLQSIEPDEFSVELGFTGGTKWVLTAEGSIKLIIKWKGKENV